MPEKRRFTPFARQCFVTGAVCCNVVGQGCLIGFAGVLLPQLERPDSAIKITKDHGSWIAAVSSIAMFFGHFLISPVMGRAGRKMAHYTVILVMLVGWLTMALAINFQGLLIGKILQGLAFGLNMPIRSILIGEYTSPRYRGGFLTIIALAKTFGILFVHLVGSVTSYKITSFISMVFPITSLLMMIYSPESPSWLATQNKHEECRKAFMWLRDSEEIPELERMIQASKLIDEKQTKKQNIIQEFRTAGGKKEFYKPVILMFAMYIILHFSGGTLLGSYAVNVLNLLMGPDCQAHVWMVALDGLRLFLNIVAIYVTNRVKRRTMLLTTGMLNVGSLLAMAIYSFIKSKGLLPYDSMWIPGMFMCLQIVSIAMGMAALPAVIAGEVFPLEYRALGGSISLIASAGSIFVLLKTFSGLVSVMGFHGTYALYSGVMLACLGVAWVLLPETSGRTLQQIEEEFRGKPLQDLADVKETEPLKRIQVETRQNMKFPGTNNDRML